MSCLLDLPIAPIMLGSSPLHPFPPTHVSPYQSRTAPLAPGAVKILNVSSYSSCQDVDSLHTHTKVCKSRVCAISRTMPHKEDKCVCVLGTVGIDAVIQRSRHLSMLGSVQSLSVALLFKVNRQQWIMCVCDFGTFINSYKCRMPFLTHPIYPGQ